MWRTAERILACPVLLLLAGTELVLAVLAFVGLGMTGRGSSLHPGAFSWGLTTACALCFVLALWGIATIVGMASGNEFARRSMRMLGVVYALLGGWLFGFAMYEQMHTPAARLSGSPLRHSLGVMAQLGLPWVYLALLAVGLWWSLSFRRPQTCALRSAS